ncbi:MAG: HAMP domain-containing protein [Phaeodactylibacter sp.]|nr:HAMP domain-containing protein [Phaeodactylibacter sp.]
MKIKTKIQLILLSNFTIFAIFGILGGYYLDSVSRSSIDMLRDNYETLSYTREMSMALHDVTTVFSIKDAAKIYRRIKLRQAFEKFDLYLGLQTRNIDELEGDDLKEALREEGLTDALREDFERFKETIWELRYEREVPVQVIMQSLNMQGLLEKVYKLNEDRIKQKTDEAFVIANRVTLFMIILGFLFFVFVVISMFYFPDYIADPINELTESIKEVARKNYSLRLDTSSKDEFGEVARSFNEMAEKLDEYESMNVLHLLSEKKRIETIINEMQDAILGVDQNQQILFVNQTMLDLSNLEEKDLVGKQVDAVAALSPILSQVFKEVISGELNGARSYPGVTLNQNGKTY